MSFSKINFWIEGDISTTRVISRLLNDVAGQGGCNTKLIGSMDWASLVDGVNVFCRVCAPAYNWLPSYLRQSKVPYVFYLDDNFWKITGSSELARYYQSDDVVNTLDEFVRGAAFVITHTQVMADFISDRFPGIRCEILPVPFDVSLVEDIVKNTHLPVRKFPVVGYAGGYKEAEFKLLESVIARLNKERPDVRFEFIGGISDGLRSLNNVQWFPGISDYSAFLAFKISRGWSVGLAPLMESEFNASKTNNKFREYGGCNIPAVFSDTSPYIECVRSEESGLLVKNDAMAWVDAIKRMLDDEELQERVKRGAFSFVESNYSHRVIVSDWRAVIDTVPQGIKSNRFESIRFDHYKRYRLLGFFDVTSALEGSSISSACKAILKRKAKSLFIRLGFKRLFLLSVLLVLCLLNFYIIKADFL